MHIFIYILYNYIYIYICYIIYIYIYIYIFFHLSNKNLLVLMKHEVLVFKVFGGGLHKLSHFNSRISTLDFT